MENKEKNSVSELMETTMTKIREMVDSNSVIGEPITTPDGVTLIPVSRAAGRGGVPPTPGGPAPVAGGRGAGPRDGGPRAGDGTAAHRPRRGLRQQEKGRERICVKAGILKSFCKKG